MKEVAYVSKRVSDITGTEAAESEFVDLVIREHPSITEPKKLDVLPAEIAGLKDAGNIVVLEIKNGETRTLVVTLTEFRKLVSDEIVKAAPSNRGRRPGWTPATNGR